MPVLSAVKGCGKCPAKEAGRLGGMGQQKGAEYIVKKIYGNDRGRRVFFFICLAISFAAIWAYNFMTPLMSDDLLFQASEYRSLLDIFRQEYKQYMTWTGRSVLQIILKIFSLMPKRVFDLCNSLCFVALTLLIYCNVKDRKKYDVFLLVLINLCVWNFSVDFDQTVLWLGGACNYLWGVVILLGFLTVFRYCMDSGERIVFGGAIASDRAMEKGGLWKKAVPVSVLLFLFGILAGWGNENTSGGGILIALLFAFLSFRKKKKIYPWTIAGIAGMAVGFLAMVAAPGNKARGVLMKADEAYSGFMVYVSRGLKINKAVNAYMMVYIVVICLLCAYLLYKGRKLEELADSFIFCLAGLATSYVLILTPEPMPRAYFGANIFFAIACIQMIQRIRKEDTLLIALKTGGIVAATIWMFFSYTENGANLARVLREVNERETYILEQTGQGNYDLTLPMLRPEFQTKYSFMYDNDISMEDDFWMNEVFRMKYGLNSIKVVPRDEWEEGQ